MFKRIVTDPVFGIVAAVVIGAAALAMSSFYDRVLTTDEALAKARGTFPNPRTTPPIATGIGADELIRRMGGDPSDLELVAD